MCTKGFRFKTLIAPLCKFFLWSTLFDHFSVYASTCQVQQLLPVFLLRNTWIFSLVMRIYCPRYTDRVCCGSPSSCTSFLGYHFWMSPELTTASRLTLRDQEEIQSSPPVWGYHHWGRWNVLCLLLVEVVGTAKWPPRSHLEYINEIPVEEGTLHTVE